MISKIIITIAILPFFKRYFTLPPLALLDLPPTASAGLGTSPDFPGE